MSLVLAYRPFIDALSLHSVWFTMLVPLALFIAVTWRAIRLPDLIGEDGRPRFPWKRYLTSVVVMTFQIVASMIGLGLLSYLLVQYAAPALVPK